MRFSSVILGKQGSSCSSENIKTQHSLEQPEKPNSIQSFRNTNNIPHTAKDPPTYISFFFYNRKKIKIRYPVCVILVRLWFCPPCLLPASVCFPDLYLVCPLHCPSTFALGKVNFLSSPLSLGPCFNLTEFSLIENIFFSSYPVNFQGIEKKLPGGKNHLVSFSPSISLLGKHCRGLQFFIITS